MSKWQMRESGQLVAFLVLFLGGLALASLVLGQDAKPPKKSNQDFWLLNMPETQKETWLLFRMSSMTHMVRASTITSISWSTNPATRNEIRFAGGTMGHEIDAEEWLEAMEKFTDPEYQPLTVKQLVDDWAEKYGPRPSVEFRNFADPFK